MNTKTLKIIQKLAKIGKILSKIVSICCIIGAIGCLVGIISMSTAGFDAFKIGGVTIHSMIEKKANLSIGSMNAYMVMGLILCIGEVFIAKLAERYFRNELAAGTPFTFEGAEEMLRLGICTTSISLGTLVAGQIACGIISNFVSNSMEIQMNDDTQIGVGIAFILVSLLCKYGAEKDAGSLASDHISGETK